MGMLLTALSTSSPAKEIYNQSDGSIMYSQTLTFQETLTANSSTNNGDISGIGADVDGSDKGDDDLETGSVNTSEEEFNVLPTSLTHPANTSCGNIKSNAYNSDVDATAKEEDNPIEAPERMMDYGDNLKFSDESLLLLRLTFVMPLSLQGLI
jgi:hypothetical protein